MSPALPGPTTLIGQLYDPLPQLADRIHDAVSAGPQTIWADDKGRVYACAAGSAQPDRAPQAIVGTYAAGASVAIIERDLRCALRERASAWIVDWDSQETVPHSLSVHRQMLDVAPKSMRRGRKIRRVRPTPSTIA